MQGKGLFATRPGHLSWPRLLWHPSGRQSRQTTPSAGQYVIRILETGTYSSVYVRPAEEMGGLNVHGGGARVIASDIRIRGLYIME